MYIFFFQYWTINYEQGSFLLINNSSDQYNEYLHIILCDRTLQMPDTITMIMPNLEKFDVKKAFK